MALVGGTSASAPLSDQAAAFLRRRVDQVGDADDGNGDDDAHAVAALVRANEQLRGHVVDLTGALKARDLEIAALQERCQLLLRSIEQQDETIAKIYAVASPETMDAIQKRPVSAAVPKKKRSVSLVEPPGEPASAPRTSESMGSFAISASKDAVGEMLSGAINRILHPPLKAAAAQVTPPRHRRMSLFDDDSSSSTTDDTSPSSCSSTLSKSSSGRNFERRESSASEQDFVKSAGFLRKSCRRSSGRVSISDYGLLDVDAVEVEEESEKETEDADNQREDALVKQVMVGQSKTEGFQHKRSRSGSSSQRNLFADIDAAKRKSNNQDDAEDDEQEMTYAEFLERLRLPASRDILETVRMFLASILGPRGDGKPPRSTDFVNYEFYGTHEFRRRCVYFFQSVEELLQNHPLWRHASETTLSKARDGIEKYVMDKLQDLAMNQLAECEQWQEEDDRLLKRMTLLSFITPDMLDIKPCMRNEVVWSMAEDELRRINSFRCPGDKINCIVRCCTIIFSVLNLSRGDSGSRPGADDFLPVFIYIVLHSKIPRLYSNCEYIATYRNPNDLMSKAGYCFVNLRSAVEFLSVVDASMLSVAEEEFNRLYEQEERKLEGCRSS